MNLSKSQNESLIHVSKKLGINPSWLSKLITFESKWNPKIKNPYSSARGLLQFIDSTARSLGYQNSLELVRFNPDISSQLRGPVYNYLRQFKPFPTKQSLAMSVFYPRARLWPAFKKFPKSVRKVNPGIVTVSDYTQKVFHDLNLLSVVVPLAIISGGYFIYKNRGLKLGRYKII